MTTYGTSGQIADASQHYDDVTASTVTVSTGEEAPERHTTPGSRGS
jgi:hypothetical protein